MTTHASRVREQVLSQHAMLRQRVQSLTATAQRVVAAGEAGTASMLARTALAPELGAFLQLIELHLTFEEHTMVPLLGATAPEGSDWAAQVLDEHTRQRAELRTMANLAAEHDDPIGVAFAVEAFLADLVIDMELEERQCLAPAVLHDPDELVVADQASE